MQSVTERPSALQVQLFKESEENQPRYINVCKLITAVSFLSLSSFYFAYSLTYYESIPGATLVQYFGEYTATTAGRALMFGTPVMGAILGSLMAPFLVNIFSRRNSILMLNLMAFIVGCLIQITNIYLLGVCRIFQGIFFAQYLAIVPVYINELVPKELKSRMGIIPQFFVIFGFFLNYGTSMVIFLAHGSSQVQWRYPFGFTQFTLILQTVMFLVGVIPESPNSYLECNKGDQARDVIARYYKRQYIESVVKEKLKEVQAKNTLLMDSIERGLVVENRLDSSRMTSDKMTFKTEQKVNWKAVLLGLQIPLMVQMNGCNGLNTQAGAIFGTFEPSWAFYAPTIFQFTALVATFIPLFLIQKFQYKPWILIGNCILGLMDICIGLLLLEKSWYPARFLMIVVMVIFQVTFPTTLGPLAGDYVGQVAPSKYAPFSNALSWIGALFCIMIIPVFQASINGEPHSAFFIFGAVSLIFFVMNCFLMKEVKGKTPNQITKEFAA